MGEDGDDNPGREISLKATSSSMYNRCKYETMGGNMVKFVWLGALGKLLPNAFYLFLEL